MSWALLGFACSVVLQAFFSASEMAVVGADRGQLRAAAAEGDKSAACALRLVKDPAAPLSVCRIGSALCAVMAPAFAYNLGFGPPILGALAAAPVGLVLGRLVPQSLVESRATALAPRLCVPLRLLTSLLRPVLALLSRWGGLFAGPHGATGAPLTREDLRLLLDSPEESALKPTDKAMIQRVFELSEATVEDVMVPLIEVVAVPHTATCADAARRMVETGRSRLPIYQDRIDRITSLVLQHDLLLVEDWKEPVTRIARRPMFVPETRRADALFADMRRAHQRMAVAVDEYGGATGILTAEDILEEIVGEIEDESDRARPLVRATGEAEWTASGRAEREHLTQIPGLSLPEGDYETLAGYMLTVLGHVPQPGERVTLDGHLIVVTKATERAIAEVIIRRPR